MLKHICIALSLSLSFASLSQCPTSVQLYEELLSVEKSKVSNVDKLNKVISLQKKFDACKLLKDSVYARILHRIGFLEYYSGKPNEAIVHTLASININSSGKKESSKRQLVNSCFNLAYYYADLTLFNDALNYYNQCIKTGSHFTDSAMRYFVSDAYNKTANIYYQNGDYQRGFEAASVGLESAIKSKNFSIIIALLHQKAKASATLSKIKEALMNVNDATAIIELNKSSFFIKDYDGAVANNLKIRAFVSEADGNFSDAMDNHRKVILARSKTYDTATLSGDYLDAGNTIRHQIITSNKGNLNTAANYYNMALSLATKINNTEAVIRALNNLAAISFRTKKFAEALKGYHESLLRAVSSFKNPDPFNNPTYQQCNALSDKNSLSQILSNKAESFLYLYKQSHNKQYLTAALSTALLTDSLITDMRHEQTGEQSKLFWRNKTREFFSNAIEACYDANDAKLAFYFMEKSRAVLLNDKLNELGASAQLPAVEAAEEQKLQINVFALQQQLAPLKETDALYGEKLSQLYTAKEALNRYIETLQNKFPAYYQYKYADAVPQLSVLQKYLSTNGQSFVHYFINDSAVYIMAITAASTKLIKQNIKDFNTRLQSFLKTCSNLQLLNNNYASFGQDAYSIYQVLFKPLAIPAGKIIICTDAATIPFEALTTDEGGKDFLIYNYAFSYVYSARHLLNRFINPPASEGNFLGVAPVAYAPYLELQSLTQSKTSLYSSASYFQNTTLLTNSEANYKNFLDRLPDYTIVTVFSHARADTEPLMFMSDSAVRLSALQLIRNPSTQLMVLSACQTNAGKLATGEGVFSLARGFASAGIPSITATLWKADEAAIYTITNTFLQNIAQGMPKDKALQAAKLSFIQNSSTKNMLPYYWANMILAGNSKPVILAASNTKTGWLAGIAAVMAIIVIATVIKRKKKLSNY